MNNKERKNLGLAYTVDRALFEEMNESKKLLQKLNFMDRTDLEGIAKVVKDLFGESDGAFVNPPFY